MKKMFSISLVALVLLVMVISACSVHKEKDQKSMDGIRSADQAINIFPKTVEDIKQRAKMAMERAQEKLDELIAFKSKERTFENSARAMDHIEADFSAALNAIELVLFMYPDQAMRDVAQEVVVELQKFAIDAFGNNVELYKAFKSYVEGNAKKEKLNDEHQYYLTENMKAFKRAGLELPDEVRAQVAAIKKEISKLSTQFETNINTDASFITATKEQLAGVDEDFISSLEKDKDEKFILKTDYPTNAQVMQHCEVEDTRKRYSIAFGNRAYPANAQVLKKIIVLRDQLAQVLGYESFAHLDIDNQMAKIPERAEQFLNDLIVQSKSKSESELKELLADLPAGITLTEDGKIKPWDFAFIKEQYRKKHFNLDDREVAQYFPMEKTVEALLDIYQQFFELTFKEVPAKGAWHEDVTLLEVYDKDGTLRGYLFLDLYPRANKYSHACYVDVVSITKNSDGSIKTPGVSVVLANFPRSTPSKPSLLTHDDVTTFFHEFGHAMHGILGATEMADFSGTSTKRDFVEVPSQMLEEWMYQQAVLKKVSSHYQTGKPLPDHMIAMLEKIKKFDSGSFLMRQAMYSQLSLEYFKKGQEKDLDGILHDLYSVAIPHIAFNPETHGYAAFGHLINYGAKYYGYMWAKVFALDLFYHIMQSGLMNPEIGRKYKEQVLGKGGSVDPNILLKTFLGREPNNKAFLENMGLNG